MSLRKHIKEFTYQNLLAKIEYEGFDYAAVNYFESFDIKDPTFQTLLDNYLDARQNLIKYIDLTEIL